MALVTGRARDTFQVIPALIGQEGRLARARTETGYVSSSIAKSKV